MNACCTAARLWACTSSQSTVDSASELAELLLLVAVCDCGVCGASRELSALLLIKKASRSSGMLRGALRSLAGASSCC